MGHAPHYGGAYDQYNPDELRDIYQSREQYLSVSDIRELTDVVQEFEKKLELRDQTISDLLTRMDAFEAREQQRIRALAKEAKVRDSGAVREILEFVEPKKEMMNQFNKKK